MAIEQYFNFVILFVSICPNEKLKKYNFFFTLTPRGAERLKLLPKRQFTTGSDLVFPRTIE